SRHRGCRSACARLVPIHGRLFAAPAPQTEARSKDQQPFAFLHRGQASAGPAIWLCRLVARTDSRGIDQAGAGAGKELGQRVLFGPFCLQTKLSACGLDVVTFFAAERRDDAVTAHDGKKALLLFARGTRPFQTLDGIVGNQIDSRADAPRVTGEQVRLDRKSTRLNSSHLVSPYAVFCL